MNIYGQLGFDEKRDYFIPTKVDLDDNIKIKTLHCGAYFTLMVDGLLLN